MPKQGAMDYKIREMRANEYGLLREFLYEAIYIPAGTLPPPKSILQSPQLQEYIFAFGTQKHDRAFVAEAQSKVVGAVWVRIMQDYGHIDNATPSLAMSVLSKYRSMGIGTALLKQMLAAEKQAGYKRISLSVQKANYAVQMYQKAGFTVVCEKGEEYIMAIDL